jgi:hypothetical protein
VKNAKPANFATLMDDIGDAFVHVLRACRRAAIRIAALPWPALLLASVLLAFALTIVPLALFLFVVFMLLKVAVAALVVNTRRDRGD